MTDPNSRHAVPDLNPPLTAGARPQHGAAFPAAPLEYRNQLHAELVALGMKKEAAARIVADNAHRLRFETVPNEACRFCGTLLSPDAIDCPRCGHPHGTEKRLRVAERSMEQLRPVDDADEQLRVLARELFHGAGDADKVGRVMAEDPRDERQRAWDLERAREVEERARDYSF